jgi:DNA segregation ATPase FtsK/SpoIIIE-like protein
MKLFNLFVLWLPPLMSVPSLAKSGDPIMYHICVSSEGCHSDVEKYAEQISMKVFMTFEKNIPNSYYVPPGYEYYEIDDSADRMLYGEEDGQDHRQLGKVRICPKNCNRNRATQRKCLLNGCECRNCGYRRRLTDSSYGGGSFEELTDEELKVLEEQQKQAEKEAEEQQKQAEKEAEELRKQAEKEAKEQAKALEEAIKQAQKEAEQEAKESAKLAKEAAEALKKSAEAQEKALLEMLKDQEKATIEQNKRLEEEAKLAEKQAKEGAELARKAELAATKAAEKVQQVKEAKLLYDKNEMIGGYKIFKGEKEFDGYRNETHIDYEGLANALEERLQQYATRFSCILTAEIDIVREESINDEDIPAEVVQATEIAKDTHEEVPILFDILPDNGADCNKTNLRH